MFKKIMLSILIGATLTACIFELYNWKQITSRNQDVINDARKKAQITGTNEFYHVDKIEKNFIKYLKIKIDAHDRLQILAEGNIPGRWKDRPPEPGPKIYYEMLNADDQIISTGSRNDPRKNVKQYVMDQGIPFRLSMPYHKKADIIKIYQTNSSGLNWDKADMAHDLLMTYKFKQKP